MVALALLNLADRRHQGMSYAVLAIFPLVSTFAVAGIFIVAVAGLCYLVLTWRRRSLEGPVLAGIVLLSAGYLLTEWQLFSLMVLGDGSHVSHRTAWHLMQSDQGDSASEAIATAASLFVKGHYHAPSLHTPTLLAASCWLPYRALSILRRREVFTPLEQGATGILAALAAIAAVTAAYEWSGFFFLKQTIAFLRSFNLRFYWLQSCGWFVLLGLLVASIGARGRRGSIVATAVATAQLAWVVVAPAQRTLPFKAATELQDNYIAIARSSTDHGGPISYREFMSNALFQEIADAIGRPRSTYRVGSIGIHPAIPVYNGFRAVDGYHNNYLLSYKHRFRKVIAAELERDAGLERYFDTWGSRVYLFSAELGRDQLGRRSAGLDLRIKRLGLDLRAFRALGGEYLFSTARIEDPLVASATQLLGRFSHRTSAWTIYVYAVPRSQP